MYKILITDKAGEDIDDLEKNIRDMILRKLKQYSCAPLYYARKMINSKIGSYRFRIGDYRVIFDMDGDDIVVLRVGHRSIIYK